MSRCVKNPHASFSLKLFMADPSAHSVLLFKDISDKISGPLLPLAKSQSSHRFLPGQPPWCSPAGLVFCFQPHPLNGSRTMSSYKGTFRKNLFLFLVVLVLHSCLGFSVAVANRLLCSRDVRASHCGGPSCEFQALGCMGFSSLGSVSSCGA